MLVDKARLYSWGTVQALRLGRPDVSLGFLGGIGDDLLCTAPIEEWLNRGARKIWFFTRHPEFYAHFDRRVRLVPEDGRYRRLAALFGRPMHPMDYLTRDPDNSERDVLPPHHIIVEMCRAAGLHGEISLRPRLRIGADERAGGALFPRQIAIQSTCLNARIPFSTKDWGAARFAGVARKLAADFNLVQVGSAQDPPLPVAADLRGHPGLRHVAAVIAASDLFVGLEGFLTHLARAVDCPSIVVMGGRARPEVYGYACNENIHRPVVCSPCGLRNGCPNSLACMNEIGIQDVVDAVYRLAGRRLPRPLPAETFRLP